ncbi:MAG: PilZ domain-containing protein [Xanthomonadales bacterium]|nr:PilZ domain-containing protein [Xanthomonadales bacterium]
MEKKPGERYQRMPLDAEVILLKRGRSWDTQGIDISATGLLVVRPENWEDPEDDHEFNIELIQADGDTIALAGRVVRVDDMGVALIFTRIPPESEAPLWRMLGAFADATELLRGGAPA